jgi:hypothetical protein
MTLPAVLFARMQACESSKTPIISLSSELLTELSLVSCTQMTSGFSDTMKFLTFARFFGSFRPLTFQERKKKLLKTSHFS